MRLTENVGRAVVMGIGSVALVGGLAFLVVGVPAIAVYLLASGILFWGSTWGWYARYQRVLDVPPEGFQPTGEVLANPGGSGRVAVYYQGIRRVYVRHPD